MQNKIVLIKIFLLTACLGLAQTFYSMNVVRTVSRALPQRVVQAISQEAPPLTMTALTSTAVVTGAQKLGFKWNWVSYKTFFFVLHVYCVFKKIPLYKFVYIMRALKQELKISATAEAVTFALAKIVRLLGVKGSFDSNVPILLVFLFVRWFIKDILQSLLERGAWEGDLVIVRCALALGADLNTPTSAGRDWSHWHYKPARKILRSLLDAILLQSGTSVFEEENIARHREIFDVLVRDRRQLCLAELTYDNGRRACDFLGLIDYFLHFNHSPARRAAFEHIRDTLISRCTLQTLYDLHLQFLAFAQHMHYDTSSAVHARVRAADYNKLFFRRMKATCPELADKRCAELVTSYLTDAKINEGQA